MPDDAPNANLTLDRLDVLTGAEQVASFLREESGDPRWTRRRVYHFAEQGQAPIHRIKGLGITARRSALREWFAKLDAPYLGRSGEG